METTYSNICKLFNKAIEYELYISDTVVLGMRHIDIYYSGKLCNDKLRGKLYSFNYKTLQQQEIKLHNCINSFEVLMASLN